RDSVARLVHARDEAPFRDVADLASRAALDQRDLPLLADAGALESLAGHRHIARWVATGIEATLPLFGTVAEPEPMLKAPERHELLMSDFSTMGLSTVGHPMGLHRRAFKMAGLTTLADAAKLAHRTRVRVAGLIGMRQQPPAAKGTVFLTLEDETAWLNVVLWPEVAELHRVVLRSAPVVVVDGRIERVDGVVHLIAAAVIPAASRTG